MLDLKNLNSALDQLAEEKGISKEKILETIEMALATPYKTNYFKKKSQKWQRDRKYSIIGTLGNYRFEIRAYFAPENKKLEQIPLICPSAYQLNAFKK